MGETWTSDKVCEVSKRFSYLRSVMRDRKNVAKWNFFSIFGGKKSSFAGWFLWPETENQPLMDRENFFLGAGQHNSWELIRIRKQLARSQKCSADSQVRPKRFLLLVPRSENFFYFTVVGRFIDFHSGFLFVCFLHPESGFRFGKIWRTTDSASGERKDFFLFVYAKEATKKISHLSFFYDFL